MFIRTKDRRVLAFTLAFGMVTLLVGCGEKEPPATSSTAAPTAHTQGAAVPAVATRQRRERGHPRPWRNCSRRSRCTRTRCCRKSDRVDKSAGSARCGQLAVAERRPQGQGTGRCGGDGRLHAAGSRARTIPCNGRHDVPRDGLDDRTRPGIYGRPGRSARCDPAPAQAGQGRGQPEIVAQMLVETEVQEGKEVVVLKPANRKSSTCRSTTRKRRTLRQPRQPRRSRPRRQRRRDGDNGRPQHRLHGSDRRPGVWRRNSRERTVRRRR